MEQEALQEVFHEAECTTTFVSELSEQSCMVLQDLSEDYFGGAISKNRFTRIQMEYDRIGNYIRIVTNLQGLIIKYCNELEGVIEKAYESDKDEQNKK